LLEGLDPSHKGDFEMRNRLVGFFLPMAGMLLFCSVLAAQTAEPTKAQTAPPPDLSGVYRQHPPADLRAYALYSFTKEDPPMTPWAEALFKANKPSFGPRAVGDSNDPTNPTTGNSVGCFPPGVPRVYQHPFPMEIIQIPGRVLMIFEFDHYVRQIYTDGREHDKNLPGTWMGDSVGHWEGDTLVVDTVNFNDKTWLDRGGHPHSDALHLTERIHRVPPDLLQIDLTIDDPKAYTKTWSASQFFQLRPKWNLMEMICEDNANFLELQRKVIAPSSKP
jgi:hypothetical protein